MRSDPRTSGRTSRGWMAGEVAAGGRAVTAAVSQAGTALKLGWRGQRGGKKKKKKKKKGEIPGPGSARGWRTRSGRREVFPKTGASLNAAAVVWLSSRAVSIIGAHRLPRGSLIRLKGSGLWLAIPTPAAGTRGVGRARSHRRLGAATGLRLRFVFRRGRPSLLVADDARVNVRGLATAKRGRRRRDGMLTGAGPW